MTEFALLCFVFGIALGFMFGRASALEKKPAPHEEAPEFSWEGVSEVRASFGLVFYVVLDDGSSYCRDGGCWKDAETMHEIFGIDCQRLEWIDDRFRLLLKLGELHTIPRRVKTSVRAWEEKEEKIPRWMTRPGES